jgi:hypothetical protein
MTGVWDGERKSCHILESFGANLLVPRNAKSQRSAKPDIEKRNGKINAALGNLSRSGIEIIKD